MTIRELEQAKSQLNVHIDKITQLLVHLQEEEAALEKTVIRLERQGILTDLIE